MVYMHNTQNEITICGHPINKHDSFEIQYFISQGRQQMNLQCLNIFSLFSFFFVNTMRTVDWPIYCRKMYYECFRQLIHML